MEKLTDLIFIGRLEGEVVVCVLLKDGMMAKIGLGKKSHENNLWHRLQSPHSTEYQGIRNIELNRKLCQALALRPVQCLLNSGDMTSEYHKYPAHDLTPASMKPQILLNDWILLQ
jgi:hypothetical protein